MYQVQNRFNKIAAANPYYSTYTCYAETIKHTNIAETTIRRWFYQLVDPEDYAKEEVRSILRYVVSIAKPRSKK